MSQAFIRPVRFALFFVLCTLATAISKAAEADRTAEMKAYRETTARLHRLLDQTPSPALIDQALHVAIESPIEPPGSKTRLNSARTILTNLFILEKALQETSVATNLTVSPPQSPSTFSGASIESIKEPAEREAELAYRGARRTAAELWNLHQALMRVSLQNEEKTMNSVAQARKRGSLTRAELGELLKPYQATKFAKRLQQRLEQTQ